MDPICGTAASVPFVAFPPVRNTEAAPLILAWHFHDPPRTEVAMASALPMRTLPAWRVYLGLPFSGSRLPAGGLDEFMRLGYEDAVLNLFGPTCRQAVEEFPAALAALRKRFDLTASQIGLLGGSVGALVALSVLTHEADLSSPAVALVSPAIQLAGVVGANERRFGVTYPWTARSRAVASHLDFIARADEIVKRDPAVLLVVGDLDDGPGIQTPAELLRQELAAAAPDRTSLVTIPGMGHALAEEPGMEAAPQRDDAARVDAVVSEWFHQHLPRP